MLPLEIVEFMLVLFGFRLTSCAAGCTVTPDACVHRQTYFVLVLLEIVDTVSPGPRGIEK